ncbi:hypothetical protein [Pediococcus stilesii]|uniref:Uncharacterized protein n=1 Tax=Pediococcus stilesii TaxID=331679 RepID=A0A0R2KWB4_9LACO|nr:hypothetical protein [Pediococcus stilesii]KRN93843.1 hypothetical protein IV81_GL000246 [Pediococcus stilesii]
MDNAEWLKKRLAELRQSSPEYRDQAFYLALNDFVQEQYKRMDQIQRELDGRMWRE